MNEEDDQQNPKNEADEGGHGISCSSRENHESDHNFNASKQSHKSEAATDKGSTTQLGDGHAVVGNSAFQRQLQAGSHVKAAVPCSVNDPYPVPPLLGDRPPHDQPDLPPSQLNKTPFCASCSIL